MKTDKKINQQTGRSHMSEYRTVPAEIISYEFLNGLLTNGICYCLLELWNLLKKLLYHTYDK